LVFNHYKLKTKHKIWLYENGNPVLSLSPIFLARPLLANIETLNKGENHLKFDLQEVSAGVYFIKIAGEKSVSIHKLLNL
jgi:hypothetical protein